MPPKYLPYDSKNKIMDPQTRFFLSLKIVFKNQLIFKIKLEKKL